MEPFSLAASVITVVDVSWKIIAYLQSAHHESKSKQQLLDEVALLWNLLRRLQQELSATPSSSTASPWADTLSSLEGPRGLMGQLSKELRALEARLLPARARREKVANALRWPFEEQEAMRVIERIHKLREMVANTISQSNHRISREILENVSHVVAVAEGNRMREILAWLSPTNFIQKHREILGSAEPESWVLSSEQYKSWHHGPLSSLWCYGPPGAGKSVLAATVYSHLIKRHRDEDITVLAAFCSIDNGQTQSPNAIMASLLRQIIQFRGDGRIPARIIELYTKYSLGKDDPPLSLADLTKLLEAEMSTSSSAFIIVDALDEIPRPADRLTIVRALHKLGPRVKVMVTSRPIADITEALSDELVYQTSDAAGPLGKPDLRWLSIDFKPLDSDLQNYVSRRLDQDSDLKEMVAERQDLAIMVEETVVKKSERLFLLARFHMDTLAECLTVFDLRTALYKLSTSLEATYFEAIERMKRSLSTTRFNTLEKLLMWVAWAERPLSITELQHALTVRPGMSSVVPDGLLPVRKITAWSAGLLFVDSNDLVQVVHPSARRFFSEYREILFPLGDVTIVNACLDYLKIALPSKALSGLDKYAYFKFLCKLHPFLKYAVRYLPVHTARQPDMEFSDRIMTVLEKESRQSFIQALYFLDPVWKSLEDTGEMHVAAYLCLPKVLSSLMLNGAGVDARDSGGCTPLMHAAMRGDSGLSTMDYLLGAGANPALSSHFGETALIRAVASDGVSLVTRLCREPDININATPITPGYHNLSALLTAFDRGNNAIADLLLARDDLDVNLRTRGSSSVGRSPLHFACEELYSVWGDDSIWAIQKLLAHNNIDINNPSTGSGCSPIFFAVLSSNEAAVRILLAGGADVNMRDAWGNSPLMVAGMARCGHPGIARLLLSYEADATLQDDDGETALHLAATRQSWDVLEVILETRKDLDVNTQDIYGETALHLACDWGSAHLAVKMLLEAGAKSGIRNKQRRTAADKARAGRHEQVLEVLQTAPDYNPEPEGGYEPTLLDTITTNDVCAFTTMIRQASPSDLDFKDPVLGTALHNACWYEREGMVRALLEAGADPDIRFNKLTTSLTMAVHCNNTDIIRLLALHGANIDEDESLSCPIWEWAYMINGESVALCLVECGCKIQTDSSCFYSTLKYAVETNSVTGVKRFIEAGTTAQTKIEGLPAIDFAEMHGANDVVSLFLGLAVDSAGPRPMETKAIDYEEGVVRTENITRRPDCGGEFANPPSSDENYPVAGNSQLAAPASMNDPPNPRSC